MPSIDYDALQERGRAARLGLLDLWASRYSTFQLFLWHDQCGCESGCCGHTCCIAGPDGAHQYVYGRFVSDHPYPHESDMEFAKRVLSDLLGPTNMHKVTINRIDSDIQRC